jgi:hypothetical protein
MSAWNDFVTVALIGAEKSAAPPLPAELDAALAGTAGQERSVQFLTQAGALAWWRRAGWTPPRDQTGLRVAEPETTKPINRASAAHLLTMLAGRCLAALPEWLGEVARLGRHLPPELVPAVLDRARQHRDLRPLALAAGGQRAQWLAAHNPDWAFAATETPGFWETGTRDQRAAILQGLRITAPAEARAKVEATWKTEPADTRAAFTEALATHLSDDDIPFLEAALDDRSKEVRRAVVDLLARLPASPFVARMLARVAPLLAWKGGGVLSRASLEVTLPGNTDAAGTRDGLDPKAFGPQKTLGEKAVLLVLILSAVPLRHWTETFQQTPEAIVKKAQKNEFAGALATGWAWAALRQRDAAWAEALLDAAEAPHTEFLPDEPLFALLPEAARAERLASMIRAGGLKGGDLPQWHAVVQQILNFPGVWPMALAREILVALRNGASGGVAWHLRESYESLLIRLPIALLPEAVDGWPVGEEGVPALVELLQFRHDALTALSQS